jgi:N-acyl-L-homoserine lactone synthetase
VLFA